MITLGINAAFHDSSAALVMDGDVLAAAEEERFTRVDACQRATPPVNPAHAVAKTNPGFHALLKAFGALTGVPVLINTSFNVRGEPVVCSAKDALAAFHGTPIDALVIGSFLLEKQG